MRASHLIRPETLPGSIYTTMVMGNPSVGLKNGIPLDRVPLEDFVVADTGHILLPPEIAERAHEGVVSEIRIIAGSGTVFDRYLGAAMDSETGCVKLARKITDLNRGLLIRGVVSIINPRRNTALEEADEITELRLCDDPACVNPRHYDLEIGANLRKTRQDLDSRLFKQLPDGRVITAWGDELINPDFSRKLLELLRMESAPYRTDGCGKLTPSQLASIKFVPLTGCWAGDKYYRGDDIDLGTKTFQFDGYSRLYERFARKKSNAHKLGHRILWAVHGGSLEPGKVLNHKCGYRRCCNPLHLEQISHYANIVHGNDMAQLRAYALDSDPEVAKRWWDNLETAYRELYQIEMP